MAKDKCDVPHALTSFSAIKELVEGRSAIVFLDYDGTLAPIVPKPDEAFMAEGMREVLERLCEQVPTAIVTGRAVAKAHSFVKLNQLFYAGSHGFNIRAPNGGSLQRVQGKQYRDQITASIAALREALVDVPGAAVEDNDLCLSVHYRAVAPESVALVERIVDAHIGDAVVPLQKFHGKKVFELRPEHAWNKGAAVQFLVEAIAREMGVEAESVVGVYIGDDVSDEDAFRVLRGRPRSVPIKVATEPHETQASYTLRNPAEVLVFLSKLTEVLSKCPRAKTVGTGGDGSPSTADESSSGAMSTDCSDGEPSTAGSPAGAGVGVGAGADG